MECQCTNPSHGQMQMRIESLEQENKTLNQFVDYFRNESHPYYFERTVTEGNFELMRLFIEKKIFKVNAHFIYDSDFHTDRLPPFFFAVKKGQLVCADVLLQLGANINQQIRGFTPLEYAIQHKRKNTADWLLERRAGVCTDTLNLACEAVYTDIILKLLKGGIKPITGNGWFGPKNTIDYAPKEHQAEIQKIFDEFAAANQTPDKVINFEEK